MAAKMGPLVLPRTPYAVVSSVQKLKCVPVQRATCNMYTEEVHKQSALRNRGYEDPNDGRTRR